MRRTFALVPLLVLVALPAASAGAPARPVAPDRVVRFEAASGGVRGAMSAAAQRAIERGPLPADAATLERLKARAAARAGLSSAAPAVVSPSPTLGASKGGLKDPNGTPSDSTGAIGTQRYVETVNSKVGIYDRSLNLLNADTLQNWWAEPGSNAFDPQVIWDPTTNRFYYTGDAVFSATDNRLAFGFSKTAAPNNATSDWCHYQVAYGAAFPDYPKLGDSKFFAIIGVNVFSGSSFAGSDILAIGKPAAGTTCPDPSTFAFGIKQDIQAGSAVHFTPVPANEIDNNKAGWVLTRPASLPATSLGIFKVTRNDTTGAPIIQNPGSIVTVPSYTPPTNAPQKDTSFLIDSGDTRLTQAVAAIDPSKGDNLHVWTQHAVAGGAGAMERWYEIHPGTQTVVRTGTVQSPSLFVYNGAISPDRAVNGATKAFGQNMILGFNTSSLTTYPAIRMVGKRGNDAVSPFVLVRSSPGHNLDFACPIIGFCRWGDYAAATPDPLASPTGTRGRVYLTNNWTADADLTGGTAGVSWRTWNWAARP